MIPKWEGTGERTLNSGEGGPVKWTRYRAMGPFSKSWAASAADIDGDQGWTLFAGVLVVAGMTVTAESPWAAAAWKARPWPAKYPRGFLEE